MMYKNTVFHFFLTVTCRERIIESMLKKDLLTPELRQECLYDANLEIRKMVEDKEYGRQKYYTRRKSRRIILLLC